MKTNSSGHWLSTECFYFWYLPCEQSTRTGCQCFDLDLIYTQQMIRKLCVCCWFNFWPSLWCKSYVTPKDCKTRDGKCSSDSGRKGGREFLVLVSERYCVKKWKRLGLIFSQHYPYTMNRFTYCHTQTYKDAKIIFK